MSVRTNLSDMIAFYKMQIKKFNKIGIGNKTEWNTVVTDNLINITKKRLMELQSRSWNLKGRNNGVI
tara:strand:+ start:194 stop:394 length:201 start_codon:yes stop_codon:yes gene_type:complete